MEFSTGGLEKGRLYYCCRRVGRLEFSQHFTSFCSVQKPDWVGRQMKLIYVVGVAAAYWLAMVGFAASIPVPNFSFEEPDVVDGAATVFGTPISGWTILYGGQSEAGVHDPLNAQYAGATGANGVLPGGAVGT